MAMQHAGKNASAVAHGARNAVQSMVQAGMGMMMGKGGGIQLKSMPPPPPAQPAKRSRLFSIASAATHPRGCPCSGCTAEAGTASAQVGAGHAPTHPRGCPCNSCASGTGVVSAIGGGRPHPLGCPCGGCVSGKRRFASSSAAFDPLGESVRRDRVEKEVAGLTRHEAAEEEARWDETLRAIKTGGGDEDAFEPDGASPVKREHGGPRGPEPTRFGDWEQKGRCSDF